MPHEFVAVGRDLTGRIVGEARQWINLPRDRAELELILDRGEGGLATGVRPIWGSVDAARPDAVRVTFGGVPIESSEPDRFELPAHEPEVPHLLQAAAGRAEEAIRGGLF